MSLPDYVEFKKFPGIPLKDIFSAAGDDLLDLIDRLLDCNPAGRVNASQVGVASHRPMSETKLLHYKCEEWKLSPQWMLSVIQFHILSV